ncbi:MAG: hypothetical protein ACFFG0_10700 [Candidatus Thorarchaeota archaeon]
MKKAIILPETIILVRDYFEGNFKTFRVLKDYRFVVDPRCHIKLIITESEYCAGSQNWTNTGLFVDHGVVTYHTRESEDYEGLLKAALGYIASATPFDSTQKAEYWNEKNRPLNTMPNILVDPSVPSDEALEDSDILEPVSEDIEEITLPQPDDESKNNLSDAWKLLLGKGNKTQ